MKKQVLIIHGGDTFGTYEEYIAFLRDYIIDSLEYFTKGGWKNTLQEKLGEEYEVVSPKMPSKSNAKYAEWKIWFEKIIPLLNEQVILVGHSLGGIFLAKYLSENKFPKEILGTFLIAAPYDDKDSEYSLADFVLPKTLELLQAQSKTLTLYHSKDDYVVPFLDLEKYKEQLPKATIKIFDTKGHFNQETFDELVLDIKEVR